MSLFSEQQVYRGTVERLITAFGNLFQGMTIVKFTADGSKDKSIPVPIEYGPRNKWLERIKAQPDFEKNIEINLPRVSFEITDYRYDAARKVGTKGAYNSGTIGQDRNVKLFNPVPYDVLINLYTICKTQKESLQLLEQILPYFSPSLTLSVEMLPEFGMRKDVPIVLQGVMSEDTYEGDSGTFRTVINTFQFVAQLDIFGPIIGGKVIKDVAVNVTQQTPSATGVKYEAVIDPLTANPTDPYNLDETWFTPYP